MDDFASSAWKKGEAADESSLPMPDLAADILLPRFGVEAEFPLFCNTLAAVYGCKPGLLIPNPVPFIAIASSIRLLPETALDLFSPAFVPPLGVAGESVPIRDRRFPDLGVIFALNGETSSLAIEAMFGRASRSGESMESVGEIWVDPASFGVTGLFVARNRELSTGMRGLVGCPLFGC